MCLPMRAHWRHLVNVIELVLLSAHSSPQPNGKLIGSAVFAQFTAETFGRFFSKSLYFTVGTRLFPPNLPLPIGGSGPQSN